MQSYVLGIDIGTGSTKAVAVDIHGKVLLSRQAYYPAGFSHTSQDPNVIWDAFIQVVRETVAVLPKPTAIALSSAMHSLMALDSAGLPITPLLTWADDRAAAIAAELMEQPLGQELYATCGTPIHAFSPLCKIRWYQLHEPEIFANTAHFVGIKEYIWYRLFNVFETDYSLASASGLFHLHRKDWFEGSLEFTGISKTQLPQPVPTTFSRSGINPGAATNLGLEQDTTFVIGASDGCLANLGTAALQPGTAAITIGTSGAVRLAGSEPRVVFPEQLFNYYLDEQWWITGGAINNGGAAVQWIARTLGYAHITEQLMASVAQVPAGSEGLLFLPFLLGERAPIWDSHSSAVFIGLQQHHGPSHLLRAVIEGVCFALRSVLEPLEQAAGAVHTLHLSGGFTRSETALQVLTNCLGKKVVLLQSEDASAIGAAMLGYKATGAVADLGGFPMPAVVQTFTPCTQAHQHYQKLYALYQPLYGQLKSTMHQLQQLA